MELAAGESLDIPLRLSVGQTCLGLQMALQFDPAVLQLEKVYSDILPGWDESTWAQPQPGLVRLA